MAGIGPGGGSDVDVVGASEAC